MKTTRPAVLLLVILVTISCATFSTGVPAVAPAERQNTSYSQETPVLTSPTPNLPPPRVVIASLTPPPLAGLPRPRYNLAVKLDYLQRTAAVRQTLTASNPAGEPLSSLTLVVEPSRGQNVFTLTSLELGAQKLSSYTLDRGLLTISLPQPVPPLETFTMTLSYELKIPVAKSWLGFTGRQLNLGDWYPFLPAYRPGTGWLVHDPAPVGEHLVYPAADYQVDLELATSPYRLVVAASAPAASQQSGSYGFQIEGARAFALSVSPEFQTQTIGRVTAYYFAEHARAARASLETASSALDYFSQLYGSNPYPGLAVVEGDFFDGMEYSGLFFLGIDYFADYPGSPLSYLTPLSAHETAHQWFYSLIGNDPALEPWLDEAFCTYSEQLYFEHVRPDLLQWWRFYRISRYTPDGRVDSTIYDHRTFRPYVNAVYLRGAQFLDELRTQVGDEAFFATLEDLVSRYSGQIVTSHDFWELLREHTDSDLSELAGQYFIQPPD